MKAFRTSVLVKPRPDLARTETGIIAAFTTVTASNGVEEAVAGYELTGRMGTPGFVEVIHVGPGGNVHPGKDMPRVKAGDICLLDIGEVNKEVLDQGQVRWLLTGENLRAQIYTRWNPKTGEEELDPTKLPRPLMNNVLTTREPDLFVKHLYGPDYIGRLVLTEEQLNKGVSADRMLANAIKFVYERVISHGPGRVTAHGKGAHIRFCFSPVPADIDGKLVVFSTTRSMRITLGELKLKLTPFQDVEADLEDDSAAA